jgi:hypothetical protein
MSFFIVFVAFLGFMLPLIGASFPNAGFGNLYFDEGEFAGGVVGTGIACASFAGITCAAGVGVFVIVSYLSIPPSLAVIFGVLIAIYSYVIARLARGGG